MKGVGGGSIADGRGSDRERTGSTGGMQASPGELVILGGRGEGSIVEYDGGATKGGAGVEAGTGRLA